MRRGGFQQIGAPSAGGDDGGRTIQILTLLAVVAGIVIVGLIAGIYGSQISADVRNIRPPTPSPIVSVSASCPGGEERRLASYQHRLDNAFAQYALPSPCHPNNGDEGALPYRMASFSKGMQHDANGHVLPASYDKFLTAVRTGLSADWDAVPLAAGAVRQFTNPQSGLAFVNEGADSHSFAQRPAPAFSSAEEAGEIVENYWMALTRDIPFADYATHPTTVTAAGSLSSLSDFRGPATPSTLFRGTSPGCAIGPYISQFLYKPCAFGANWIDQRLTPPVAGVDFMTNMSTWLHVQNGAQPLESFTYMPSPRFIRNGRDLSHWVHIDVLFQAYFHAMLILLNEHAPLKPNIPYTAPGDNEMGFATFGGPHIAQLATNSATTALKAVWFQKWFVHRRLRPEVFAQRLHAHLTSSFAYPPGVFHPDVLTSNVLAHVFAAHGSYFLPQAFPEGSPLHPSYGAGHATVAGAAVTILKAVFDEDWILPSPVAPNPADGGQTLVPLSLNLTVGHELNKLAENIAIGRNIAGVHWRSDAYESLRLGERVAVSILRDMKNTFNEPFSGWTFRNFDGDVVHV